MQNKPSFDYFMHESAKKASKPYNQNLPSTIKNMTMLYNSNHFNTII